jgi:pimeloyl-ACP methyl ester carboxylesterase
MPLDRHAQWCTQVVQKSANGWLGRFVGLEGELIHYVEKGEGDPLILLHGFLAWSFTWRHNVEMVAKNARVIAPDLRGFGLSTRHPERGHSLSDQVLLLDRLLEALGLKQVILGGHSMGGEVALRYAAHRPERVKALILVASSGYLKPIPGRLERAVIRYPILGSVLVRAVMMNRRFTRMALGSVYRSAKAIASEDVEGYFLPARVRGAAGALVRTLRDSDFGQGASHWQGLSHPTLIIWGENDPLIPLSHGQKLAAELPGSQLLTFPDCGHVPHEEDPSRFNAAVQAFIDSLRSR